MSTELERRIREALHDDAQRARLVNPDGPRASEPQALSVDRGGQRGRRWIAVAAAAVAVLALIGALTLLDDDQDVDTVPAVTQVPVPVRPTNVLEVEGELEPGPYFIDPDGDASTPLTVTYEIADEGWGQWLGAAKLTNGLTNGPHVNLSITTVTNVTTDACLDHQPADPAVGPTVDDLATALSELSPFELTAPPSDVTILGYQGKHLQVAVPDGPFITCQGEWQLASWISPLLGPPTDGAYHGYNGPEPGLTEDFWILDVDGTRLVLEYNTSPDAPAEAVAERQAIFDSIQIQP
jgi:hypothetical protein